MPLVNRSRTRTRISPARSGDTILPRAKGWGRANLFGIIVAALVAFAPSASAQWLCPDQVEVVIDCESCVARGWYWGTAYISYFAAGPPPTYYYQGDFYDGLLVHYHFSFLLTYDECPKAWEGDFTPRSLFVWPY